MLFFMAYVLRAGGRPGNAGKKCGAGGGIMAMWKCNKCWNTVDGHIPPETCPSCKEKCEYVNVTCYIPECGGPASRNIISEVFGKSSESEA